MSPLFNAVGGSDDDFAVQNYRKNLTYARKWEIIFGINRKLSEFIGINRENMPDAIGRNEHRAGDSIAL